MSAEHEDLVLSGELEKQGGSHKNWKRRYFEVRKEGIIYKRSAKDPKPLKPPISLESSFCAPAREADPRRPFCFVIYTTQREYNLLIDAGSETNLEKWVMGIRLAKLRFFGKHEKFAGDDDEVVVRNELQSDRDVLLIDKEKEVIVKNIIETRLLDSDKGWTGKMMNLLDEKRTEYALLHTLLGRDMYNLKLEKAQILHDAQEKFIEKFVIMRKESAAGKKQHAEDYTRILLTMKEECAHLKEDYSKSLSAQADEKVTVLEKMQHEVQHLNDVLAQSDASKWELQKEMFDLQREMALLKQTTERQLAEKEKSCVELIAKTKGRIDEETRCYREKLLRERRAGDAKVQLILTKQDKEHNEEFAKLLFEKDQLLVKAKFGQDVVLENGDPVEFYTGRALEQTTERLTDLSARVESMEGELLEQKEQYDERYYTLEEKSKLKEIDLKQTIEQFQEQLQNIHSVHEKQLELFRGTHAKEIGEVELELSKVRKEVSELRGENLKLTETLHTKEAELEKLNLTMNTAVSEAISEMEVKKAEEVAVYKDEIAELSSSLEKAQKEVETLQVEKAKAAGKLDADRSLFAHMQLLSRIAALEKESLILKSKIKAQEMESVVENEEFSYYYSVDLLQELSNEYLTRESLEEALKGRPAVKKAKEEPEVEKKK